MAMEMRLRAYTLVWILKNIFNENISIPDFFKDAYSSSSSLSEAVRKYMNYLFSEYGLRGLFTKDLYKVLVNSKKIFALIENKDGGLFRSRKKKWHSFLMHL